MKKGLKQMNRKSLADYANGAKRNTGKGKKHLMPINSEIHDPTLVDSMDDGGWGDDCGCDANALWNKVKGTLTDAMLGEDNAIRISQNTGFCLVALYSMVYGVRVPNLVELLHLCDKLIMK